MTGFFTQIEDTDEVRQGDIIRKLNPKTGEAETLGIVVTADCDIAQRKAGERYTCLEIVPMAAYIKGPWAHEQLRKLSEKAHQGDMRVSQWPNPQTTAWPRCIDA